METMSAWFLLLICIGHFAVCDGKAELLESGAVSVPCSLEAYDADGDGLITETEVEDFFLENHSEAVAENWRESFFVQFDLNHDHLIQVEEFYLDKAYQEDCILSVLMKG
ncbi:uncharacterized protein LOC110451129 [Mizuhopecten yessoensis]|uniref:uncharacterized protein LOC110451129 n=1 Tax=Mizuhopecten yessoensis TaxID=6573 RepID=UPI000B45CD4E|nr:uncharacterized protein LOC110451129 [Mizuhopecten yessoensis]